MTLTTAVAALEAGRYLPNEEGWPTVAAALKCLHKTQNKELWQAECEQIAELTGLEIMDARAFWKRAGDIAPGAPNRVAVAVQLCLRDAQAAAAEEEHSHGSNSKHRGA